MSYLDTGASELITDLVREERELRCLVTQKRLDFEKKLHELREAEAEMDEAKESHAQASAKLKSLLALAGRQRMPSARPRADKGKARK